MTTTLKIVFFTLKKYKRIEKKRIPEKSKSNVKSDHIIKVVFTHPFPQLIPYNSIFPHFLLKNITTSYKFVETYQKRKLSFLKTTKKHL